MASIVRSSFVTSTNGFGVTHDLGFGTSVTTGNAIVILLHEFHDVQSSPAPTVNGVSGPPSATIDYSVDHGGRRLIRT